MVNCRLSFLAILLFPTKILLINVWVPVRSIVVEEATHEKVLTARVRWIRFNPGCISQEVVVRCAAAGLGVRLRADSLSHDVRCVEGTWSSLASRLSLRRYNI